LATDAEELVRDDTAQFMRDVTIDGAYGTTKAYAGCYDDTGTAIFRYPYLR